MKKKPLSFNEYKMLLKMPYNAVNVWVSSIYKSGYNDCQNEIFGEGDGTAYILDAERLYQILQDAGIPQDKIDAVMGEILNGDYERQY